MGVDFQAMLTDVQRVVARHTLGVDPEAPAIDDLDFCITEIDRLIAAAGPLPNRLETNADELRVMSRYLREYILNGGQLPPAKPSFHAVVELLMRLNYLHIAAASGETVARKCVGIATARAINRRRGRQPTVPLETLQRAKAMREEGRTFGDIARRLRFRSASAVRLSLRYHYR